MNTQANPSHRRWLLAGILLIAMNLRAPFTSVAPLIDTLKAAFRLTAGEAGLLITLPLLSFAAISPFAAGIARRWGIERSLFGALLVVAAGIALRSAGSIGGLYCGTVVIGCGIAVGNVLLPGLLKREYPDRVALLTAVYVLAMGIAAAAVSALAVPLFDATGGSWRLVTASALWLPVVAAIVWLPRLRSAPVATRADGEGGHGGVWRSALGWQVTLFLGLDCFLYYVGVGWLPGILHAAAFTDEQAGSLHGVLLLATALPGLLLIPVVPRMRDQRVLAAGLAVAIAIGLLGLLLAAKLAVVWILCFGFGAGGGLILALSFISLRTAHAHDAASLSGMAQCMGYLLAAAGPPLVGAMHDRTGSWQMPLGLCVALAIVMAGVGMLAGRARRIGERPVTRATITPRNAVS